MRTAGRRRRPRSASRRAERAGRTSAARADPVVLHQEEAMLNNLNSVLIEGNLVRDPELKYSPKGTAVCSFALACNRYFKQDEETQKEVSFFDVTTWSRLAEVCGEYLKKGRGVRVVGRLKQDRWTNPEGQARSKIEIVAEHVEFKPQVKKDGEEKTAEGQAETVDEVATDDAELKEAANF
jgi:single-strand DNA-binding protein